MNRLLRSLRRGVSAHTLPQRLKLNPGLGHLLRRYMGRMKPFLCRCCGRMCTERYPSRQRRASAECPCFFNEHLNQNIVAAPGRASPR